MHRVGLGCSEAQCGALLQLPPWTPLEHLAGRRPWPREQGKSKRACMHARAEARGGFGGHVCADRLGLSFERVNVLGRICCMR